MQLNWICISYAPEVLNSHIKTHSLKVFGFFFFFTDEENSQLFFFIIDFTKFRTHAI